jgi:UDP-N-acetylglucosamine/UDP-N-acetylgalactosamine diphosphorylase
VLYAAIALPGGISGGERHFRVENLEHLRARFEELDQGHVFRFWDRLDGADREALLTQLGRIDLGALASAIEATRRREAAAPPALSPAEVERVPAHGGDPTRWDRARERGEQLLAEGRVAALVVAGGQATRLGYPGPKGCFPIGPVTERSLFELQAQKLRRMTDRFGRPVPWYVMTSPATNGATRCFFKENGWFGLPENDVFFFQQGMVPSIDFDGRLMLASPSSLCENPDGHGGCLTALLASGALDDMDARGVSTLFYYQVDNPLIRMADPAFLGFHAESASEMSCKVVSKATPDEKMGIIARVGDALGVVEYTELDDVHRDATDASGDLVYWTGSPAIHAFDTAFVRRIASEADR